MMKFNFFYIFLKKKKFLFFFLKKVYSNENGDVFFRELPFLELRNKLSVSPFIPVL
jgi:hypothetical protein